MKNASMDERVMIAGSIPTRGSDVYTPCGTSQCKDIAGGSNHAAIIVEGEELYTYLLFAGNGPNFLSFL